MENKVHWETLEYDHKDRSNDWYWAVGIIALCAVVVSVLYKNYFFAVFLLLATALVYYKAKRKPLFLKCYLSDIGITVGNIKVPYSEVVSFWIEINNNPHQNHMLIVKMKKGLHPILNVNVPDDKAVEVFDFLSTKATPEEMSEGQVIKMIKHLGF
jgi:hypothetical protein